MTSFTPARLVTTSEPSETRWSGRQLAEFVTDAAADARRWARLVGFDEHERFALKLDEDDERDLWLLTWLPGQHTGWHDHGGSNGAFAVARGALHERRYVAGHGRREIRLGPRASRIVPDPVLHDVRNQGPASAISLHAYSPPLRTMTYFDERLDVSQIADIQAPGARAR